MNDSEYIERVRRMERCLYRVAYAILWNDADCADAVSEAVFRGWMKKNGLRSSEYLETWLTRILINCSRDILKKRKSLPLDEASNAAAPDPVPDPELREALRMLPDKYRIPLILHHLEGFGLSEIAEMLKIPERLVKSRLHQARRLLAKLMEEECL